MLAGNADRERAVDVLRAAYAEGRLAKDEYEQRMGRAMTARTIEQLQDLTADVPHGPSAMPPALPPAWQLPYGQGQVAPYRPREPAVPHDSGRQNRMAAAALACGLLAPMVWGAAALPAVVLGHLARAEIRRTGERGDGMAVAGLALGWLWIGAAALVLTLVVVVLG